MDIDLEKLERLAKAATPGPWYPANNHTAYDGYGDSVCTTEQTHNLDNNLDYIVAACNSLPKLIAENRALQERVRELERQNEALAFWLAQFLPHAECPIFEDCPLSHKKNVDVRDCAKQLTQGVLDHD